MLKICLNLLSDCRSSARWILFYQPLAPRRHLFQISFRNTNVPLKQHSDRFLHVRVVRFEDTIRLNVAVGNVRVIVFNVMCFRLETDKQVKILQPELEF